jgi:hypothetical protein
MNHRRITKPCCKNVIFHYELHLPNILPFPCEKTVNNKNSSSLNFRETWNLGASSMRSLSFRKACSFPARWQSWTHDCVRHGRMELRVLCGMWSNWGLEILSSLFPKWLCGHQKWFPKSPRLQWPLLLRWEKSIDVWAQKDSTCVC